MIPPKWNGWLNHQYDDVPTPDNRAFHDPFFEIPHDWRSSETPFKLFTPRQTINNERNLDFAKYRQNRYSREW